MDNLSILLNKLKIAAVKQKKTVFLPHSKISEAIMKVLENQNFLKMLSKKNKKGKNLIEVEILYTNNKPNIHSIDRVSKLSKRIYKKSRELYPYVEGFGYYIISTPNGIMTDREARKAKVGGEVLFKIW